MMEVENGVGGGFKFEGPAIDTLSACSNENVVKKFHPPESIFNIRRSSMAEVLNTRRQVFFFVVTGRWPPLSIRCLD